jgi:WD40 repeat protein
VSFHIFNGSEPHSRFDSVLAEIQRSEEEGQRIDQRQYLDRFPELADALHDYFRDREWFARVAPVLAPTAAPSAAVMPQPDLPPASCFAGHEIIRRLGHGGMGIVYHARQYSPEREVALKVIRTDRLAGLSEDEQRQWLERFRRESQFVASLEEHPNLVTLYGVGEHEGRPFFTMRLLRDGSLADAVSSGKWVTGGKESMSKAAKLVATVARAIDYVHQRGLLHLDLKLGNILLDGARQPLVSDFGLARRLDQSGSLVAGAIEGTAEYMPPEQACRRPGAVTTAADIYSLGAILYVLLTGKFPFKGSSDIETLMLVQSQEPTPPQSLNPHVPRDLEAICLKCLEKEPGRRYVSSAALADDLENWLAGRPTNARRASTLERAWRWCRRNPVPTFAAGIVLAVAVAAFVLITDSRNKALTLADEKGKLADANSELANTNRKLADDEHKQRTEAERLAGVNEGLAEHERELRKEAQARLARTTFDQGLNRCDRGDLESGVLWQARALDIAHSAENIALEQAIRANLTIWGSQFTPLKAVLQHPDAIYAIAFSPDGKFILTGGRDGTACLWNAETGERIGDPLKHPGPVSAVAFSPDSNAFLTGSLKQAQLWDVHTRMPIGAALPHDGQIEHVAISTDGKLALTGAKDDKRNVQARLWDLVKNVAAGPPIPHRGPSWALTFSPDCKVVLFEEGDRFARLWDAMAGKPLGPALEHGAGVMTAAFSPDSRLVVTAGGNLPAKLWEVSTGKAIGPVFSHDRPVNKVAFSSDGKVLLTAGFDHNARLWDVAKGSPLGPPLPFRDSGVIYALAFSPDSRTVCTASGKSSREESWGEAQLWDVATGRLLGRPVQRRSPIYSVAFSPDGRSLLMGTGYPGHEYLDKNIAQDALLWSVPFGANSHLVTSAGPVHRIAFSPDGRVLLTGHLDGTAWLRDPSIGKPFAPVLRHQGMVREAVFSPDGQFVLTAAVSGTAQLWQTSTGKPVGKPISHPVRIMAAALSPDARRIITAGDLFPQEAGEARIWRLDTGHALGEPIRHDATIYAVAFSPDGKVVATGSVDGSARLWDAETGNMLGRPLRHQNTVIAIAFSPDGKRLATASADGTAQLWDPALANPVGKPLRHRQPVVALAFSRDSKILVTGSHDRTARVWSADQGLPVSPPLRHAGQVTAVALSPDGRTVLTGAGDRTARLWDAHTGIPLGPPLRHSDRVESVAFSPDGMTIVSGDARGLLSIWQVPAPAEWSIELATTAAETLALARIDEDNTVVRLSSAGWRERRQKLNQAASIQNVPASK